MNNYRTEYRASAKDSNGLQYVKKVTDIKAKSHKEAAEKFNSNKTDRLTLLSTKEVK